MQKRPKNKKLKKKKLLFTEEKEKECFYFLFFNEWKKEKKEKRKRMLDCWQYNNLWNDTVLIRFSISSFVITGYVLDFCFDFSSRKPRNVWNKRVCDRLFSGIDYFPGKEKRLKSQGELQRTSFLSQQTTTKKKARAFPL